MPSLELPGTGLYYQIQGSGPLIILVPGAKGDADTYRDLADHLDPAGYLVVTYDGRGFSAAS